MYNSFIIRFSMKIWDIFVLGYEDSLVKKIVDGIIACTSYLFKGSIVKDMFIEDKQMISKGSFYKVSSWILEKASLLLRSLNNYIKKIGNSSVIYKSIYNLFEDEIEIIRTISIFFLFFGIGVFVNSLRIGDFNIGHYLFSTILIFGSLIIIFMAKNLKDILYNSHSYNFIKDLLTIDEEGEQWW